jgi:hypothetical protein
MTSLRPFALLAALAAGLCAPAHAASWFGSDGLKPNNDVERAFSQPVIAMTDGPGRQVSAGVVYGLHGPVQASMGRTASPALTLSLAGRTKIHLVPTNGRGAMLVFQTAP